MLVALYHRLDRALTAWMARYGVGILRVSLGVVFFWFGVLKFFPGMSPATYLAGRTIEIVSFGTVSAGTGVMILAAWETAIGLGLIFGVAMRVTLLLLFVQMVGTIAPMFLFPREVFVRFPYAPTLEGQYIIKNLVLVAAGIVIGATVRGGGLVSEPRQRQETQARPRRIQP